MALPTKPDRPASFRSSVRPRADGDRGRSADAGDDRATRAASAPAVEVKLAGAVVRVASGMDGALLTAVLRAVRASAA